MKKGILYFHQGYTDIINCFGLIDYYMVQYDELIVLCVDRARDIINFYIKNKPKVSIIFISHYITTTHTHNMVNFIKYNKNIQVDTYDLLFHGIHELERRDSYKNGFSLAMQQNNYFVKSFYVGYDIDYMTRIKDFNIVRDLSLENTIYDIFTLTHGKKYIVYHEILEVERNPDIVYVNLSNISSTFFDYIKVLENSIEIHLLDSVWAGLIYLLDCKYKLFQSKKIVLYAKRGHVSMFTDPVKLNNWIIKL